MGHFSLRRKQSRPRAHLGANLRHLFMISTLLVFSSVVSSVSEARYCEGLFVPTFTSDRKLSTVPSDPAIVRAVELGLYEDLKTLTDLIPVKLTDQQRRKIESETLKIFNRDGEAAAVRYEISRRFRTASELTSAPSYLTKPRWTLGAQSPHKATFDYIERTWKKLVRMTPRITPSTLIPLPHPIIIPGARFQEAYYWDSYFALQSLISSGRSRLLRGQIENFLYMSDKFGVIPNGNRDYYLSRSQPPVLTRMVREYLDSIDGGRLSPKNAAWLRDRVLPTLIRDYREFWMNPKTRFDEVTGLNHHYDSENTPRPERHRSDKESELGNTYRDVRAEAESGKDFTVAFQGEATNIAGVLLNSVLHGVERDIALLLRKVGKAEAAKEYDALAVRRRDAMLLHMRDPETGLFFDYNLRTEKRVEILTADTFATTWAGVVDGPMAQQMSHSALARLERAGGIMSSEVESGKQWDAPFTWAPHIMFAVDGLKRVGLNDDAMRVARNWVETVDRVHARMGTILEKYDAVRAEAPIEAGDKYTTQQGFLWSNGVYSWIVVNVFGEKPIPIPN
jgi:alpha,alpha-trehalase